MNKRELYKGDYTLATTDILQFDYLDFKDWYLDNYDVEDEDEIPDEHSSEFWDWCADEWECDLDNIKCCGKYNVPCVITGTLGLWNGRPDIIPVKMDSVYDAIMKIARSGVDDIDVKFVNGIIEVQGHHHDGTNCFEIHALTQAGIRRFENAESRYEDVNEVKPYMVKKLPYLYAIF